MAVSLRATRDPVGLELKMHNGQCGGRQIPCQCHSIERCQPSLIYYTLSKTRKYNKATYSTDTSARKYKKAAHQLNRRQDSVVTLST
ncbi:hypothetical protein J6590_025343 [Homalodisca vitripennis]|nr:hypothetical protein J6590_025343 [Homalodisca vitripennis]